MRIWTTACVRGSSFASPTPENGHELNLVVVHWHFFTIYKSWWRLIFGNLPLDAPSLFSLAGSSVAPARRVTKNDTCLTVAGTTFCFDNLLSIGARVQSAFHRCKVWARYQLDCVAPLVLPTLSDHLLAFGNYVVDLFTNPGACHTLSTTIRTFFSKLSTRKTSWQYIQYQRQILLRSMRQILLMSMNSFDTCWAMYNNQPEMSVVSQKHHSIPTFSFYVINAFFMSSRQSTQ